MDDWLKAVEHFTKALQETELSTANQPEEHPRLTEQQQLKAALQIAIITQRISREMANKARYLFEAIEDPDHEIFDSKDELDSLIQAEDSPMQDELEYPYVLITGKTQKFINDAKLHQLLDDCKQPIIVEKNKEAKYLGKRQSFTNEK